MSRKVYTYYAPLNGRNPEDEYRLLLLWKSNWKAMGYDPVVLNEWHARRHLAYQAFNERIKELPSINPPEYERACYLRHLAYSMVGGGIVADYDLFCYDDEVPGFGEYDKPSNTLQCYQQHVPSLMIGNTKAFDEFIRGIMEYKVGVQDVTEFGRPHVSDMHILLKGNVKHERKNLVKNYGEQAWEEFPFTHWSSGAMSVNKMNPKWKFISELRKIKE